MTAQLTGYANAMVVFWHIRDRTVLAKVVLLLAAAGSALWGKGAFSNTTWKISTCQSEREMLKRTYRALVSLFLRLRLSGEDPGAE